MGGIIFFAVMLLLAWAVIVLPQQRRMRAHRALVTTLEIGDEVMTTSGILGTIMEMDDEIVRLEVAPGIELRFVRGAIARKVDEPGDDPADDEADDVDASDDDEIVLDEEAGHDSPAPDGVATADVTEDAETS